HLIKIGELIGNGIKKLAVEHNLNIDILPPKPLVAFSLNYDNALEIKTLFTQEMLKRGYIATPVVYVSFSHTEDQVNEYLIHVDEVFGIIEKAIKQENIIDLLDGPIAHDGFQRLT
ncbi:MAG: aminotransferase class III, partial [Candidatus Hermodarchaeota archaeon]